MCAMRVATIRTPDETPAAAIPSACLVLALCNQIKII